MACSSIMNCSSNKDFKTTAPAPNSSNFLMLFIDFVILEAPIMIGLFIFSPKYVHERGRILTNKEYTTPMKLLKHDPFFQEFFKSKKSTFV